VLTWNQIVDIVADAAGVRANIVHLPSELIAVNYSLEFRTIPV